MINENTILSQKNAVISSITRMDISTLSGLLDNTLYFQKFSKEEFLSRLTDVFDEFHRSGDEYLEAYNGKCNRCNKCDSGLSFIGNHSRAFIDLILKSEQEEVIDIFECSDFLNDNNDIIKLVRLYIHDVPF